MFFLDLFLSHHSPCAYEEFKFIYEQQWEERSLCSASLDPEAVFDLSQNPQVRRTWTSKNGRLPCFKTSSMLWHAHSKRFLLPIELAAASGIPVTESLARCARVPLDCARALYSQENLGNGMHIASASAVLCLALASCPQLERQV